MTFHHLRRVVIIALLFVLLLTAGFPTFPNSVFSQNPSRSPLIESDNLLVLRHGDWQTQSTPFASGGVYLYNTVPASSTFDTAPVNVPALLLNFTGPSIEILYTTGPSLGILAVEVDDVVLRTIITTADTTQFQQRVIINYLTNEAHTLRVYPAQGTVGIDAFVATLPQPDTIAAAPTCPQGTTPQLISYTPDGVFVSDPLPEVSFSADGRYVIFDSTAPNLVPNDTNGYADVFMRDMQTCTTEIISVSSTGEQGNGESRQVTISPDGRFIVFRSRSTNFPPLNAPTDYWNLFVRDRQTNTTTAASLGANGEWGNNSTDLADISADGRFVVFTSFSNNLVPGDTNTCYNYNSGRCPDVFLRDFQTNTLTIVSRSPSGGQSYSSIFNIGISADGNWIGYDSEYPMVWPDNYHGRDVYLINRVTNQTIRVSVASDGTQANSATYFKGISADGRYILMTSYADNLVPNDHNADDVFVYDRVTSEMLRATLTVDGTEWMTIFNMSRASPRMSDAGDAVFDTLAGNVYMHHRATRQTRQLSVRAGNVPLGEAAYLANLSDDGQWVAFRTAARLHPDDTNMTEDLYIVPTSGFDYELPPPVCPPATGPRLLMYTPSGQVVTNLPEQVSMSDDGRYVAFQSNANNLAPNDANNQSDIFVRDMTTCVTELISVSATGGAANHYSASPLISSDGRYVSFTSWANDLVAGDPYAPGGDEVFMRDRQTDVTILGSAADNEDWGNWYSTDQGMSDDGRYVAFVSYSNNLVPNDTNACDAYQSGQCPDVFLRDTQTGATSIISRTLTGSQVNGAGGQVLVSGDGNWIVYSTSAADVVAGDTNNTYDVFLVNRVTGETSRVSVASDGTQANGRSTPRGITPDGRYILMISEATNLVPYDFNSAQDVFVYDRVTSQMRRVSVASNGEEAATGSSLLAYISNDGRYVAFESTSSNLALNDTGNSDVFIHDLQTGHTLWVSAAYGTGANLAGFSGDGQWIAVRTSARLHNDDTSSTTDLYLVPVTNFPYEPPPLPDTLALFNSSTNMMSRVASAAHVPPPTAFTTYATGRTTTGQWVMGDWDGDGHDSPAQFRLGAMIYTNEVTTTTNWVGIWLGPVGYPVAGRFDPTVNHDCVGVVHSFEFPPFGTGFALYFTCDLTSGVQPPLDVQWLSVLLADVNGFSGTHQFSAGDFDGDGVDTIAVRRGDYIAWTNVHPTELLSAFDQAQYFHPIAADDPEGYFVVGDWDLDGLDSFGYFYPDGQFYFKTNLWWNEGMYYNQQVGLPVGTPATAASWR